MLLPATGRTRGPSPRRTCPPTSSTPASSSGCSSPSPRKPSDQVAALAGVTPAAIDPGQPVRLALRQGRHAPCCRPRRLPRRRRQRRRSRSGCAAAPQPQLAAAAAPAAGSSPRSAGTRCRSQRHGLPRPGSSPPPIALAKLRQHAAARPAKVPHASLPAAAAPPGLARRRVRQAALAAAIRTRSSSSAPTAIAAAGHCGLEPAAQRYQRASRLLADERPVRSPEGTFCRLSVQGFASAARRMRCCASLRQRAAAPASSATSPATRRSRSPCALGQTPAAFRGRPFARPRPFRPEA